MTIDTLERAKKLKEKIDYCDSIINKMQGLNPQNGLTLEFSSWSDHPRIQVPYGQEITIYDLVLKSYNDLKNEALKELEEL